MPRKSNKIISIQSVPGELWEKIHAFLDGHKLMNMSDLGRKAIENYITLASEHGIDHDWNIRVPKKGEGEGEA